MNRNESELREPRAPEGPEMIASMRQGVIEALLEHKSEGRPVIAWDRASRQVVEIPPEGIIIPEVNVDGSPI